MLWSTLLGWLEYVKRLYCAANTKLHLFRGNNLCISSLCHCSSAEGLLQNGWITLEVGYSLPEEGSVCTVSQQLCNTSPCCGCLRPVFAVHTNASLLKLSPQGFLQCKFYPDLPGGQHHCPAGAFARHRGHKLPLVFQ